MYTAANCNYNLTTKRHLQYWRIEIVKKTRAAYLTANSAAAIIVYRDLLSTHMEEENDGEKVVKWYIRAAIIIGCLFFLCVLIWAIIHLNYKIYLLRKWFWPFMKLLFWLAIIWVVIVLLLVWLINYYSKTKMINEEKERQQSRKGI